MRLAVVVTMIFDLLRERLAMETGDTQRKGQGWRGFNLEALAKLSDERIRELVREWLDRALAEAWESWLLGEYTPQDPDEMRDIMTDLYADTMEALEARDYRRIEGDAAEVLQGAGLAAADQVDQAGPDSSGQADLEREARLQYLKLADVLLLARAAVLEASSSPSFRGELVPNPDLNVSAVLQLQEAGFIQPPGPMPSAVQGPPHPAAAARALPGGGTQTQTEGPRLSEALAKYIAVKSPGWKPTSRKDTPKRVSLFVDTMRDVVVGGDAPVTAITRDHVRSFCDVVKRLPKRRSQVREYREKSLAELARLDVPQEKRLDQITYAEVFTAARGFLNWVEEEYGQDCGFQARWLNGAFQMPKGYKRAKAGKARSTRGHFTVEELVALFSPNSYLPATASQPSRFWLPLMALFTGMRINEIAQLRLADLRQEDEVWVFDVNSGEGEGKTEAGKRRVPIHPFLIEALGLLDYAGRTMKDRPDGQQLFPELRPNVKEDMGHTVGQWFTRYRRGLGIGGQAGEKSAQVFHSFRHTVITHLYEAKVRYRWLQEVVGHEQGLAPIVPEAGITPAYVHPTIATLRDEVIRKLTWDQDIPALAELAASPWARGKRPKAKP